MARLQRLVSEPTSRPSLAWMPVSATAIALEAWIHSLLGSPRGPASVDPVTSAYAISKGSLQVCLYFSQSPVSREIDGIPHIFRVPNFRVPWPAFRLSCCRLAERAVGTC